VVENLRFGREHGLNRRVVVIEIGDENFDDDARVRRAHRFNRSLKVLGAAILQIVTGDRCDDDMSELHPSGRLRHPRRFVGLQRKRFGGGDGAKVTIARAAIARDHEGGCSLAPAFPMIRAFGTFAYGMKP